MNKTIYIAPEVEQIKVRTEENFLASAERVYKIEGQGEWDE